MAEKWSRSFEMKCFTSVRSDKNHDNYRVDTLCCLGHRPQSKLVGTLQLGSVCSVVAQIHKIH